jgi:ubiquinone/menaquinone biosynthesis C-methylase UbiE
VLEVGIGTGDSLAMYDTGKVDKLYGLDPQLEMIQMASRAAKKVDLDVEFLNGGAESITVDDHSVDTVLSTFTFCTIPDLPRALAEMRRVLRPGGRILFFEHGLSPDRWVERWQYFEEPLHRWIFQGCHLTREIPREMEEAGFRILEMDTSYLPRCPKPWGYTWRGVAGLPVP